MDDYDLNSASALDRTEALLRRLVILKSEEHYWALTLWIAYCYSIPSFDFAPRLCLWSPEKRCGKSLTLEVVGHLLPNPLLTSSVTPPALFRLLDKEPNLVVLIDESDTVFGRNADKEKAEALRQLLNTSFKRGQKIPRCEGPRNEVRTFSIFAPIALAGIGKNAIPETVADRAIMVEMRRMLPNEMIHEFESDEVDQIFQPVKNLLQEFSDQNSAIFRELRPDLPKEDLNPRARDLWKPLYKVAECAGEAWIRKVRSASIALSEGKEDPEEASLSLRLLSDTREVFESYEEKLSTRDLIERLRALEEAPWNYLDRFNPSVLSNLLKNYGVRPKPFGGGKIRGYYRKSFEDPWNRYLAPLETVTPVTLVTQEEFNLEECNCGTCDACDGV